MVQIGGHPATPGPRLTDGIISEFSCKGKMVGKTELQLVIRAMPSKGERANPSLSSFETSSSVVSNRDFLKKAARGDRVLIVERDPCAFVEAFLTAVEKDCAVFLADPDWNLARMEFLLRLIRPHLVIGTLPSGVPHALGAQDCSEGARPAIMIPTGGSSGGIRFAVHTWDTLRVAAEGFWSNFGREPLNFCCMLPLYHVSGLMQVMRTLISGGDLSFHSYTSLLAGRHPECDPANTFISLVPTQLTRLLQNGAAVSWLGRLRAILLGGGPAPTRLLEEARELGLPLAPSYGMTESAAAVTLLAPDEFLAGGTGVGRPLPHAEILLRDPRGLPAPPQSEGRVILKSEALFRGYYPEYSQSMAEGYASDDHGYFDEAGRLHITGRLDEVINSGGEMINPLLVQRAIGETGLVSETVVVGAPDPEWGECVVAVYVPREDLGADAEESLRAALEGRVAPHEMPKKWLRLKEIPRTPLGKLDRAALDL